MRVSRFERYSHWATSCNLNLGSVTIIWRIKKDNFISLLYQTYNWRKQSLDSSINCYNLILWINFREPFVKISNRLNKVQRSKCSRVLMLCYILKLFTLFLCCIQILQIKIRRRPGRKSLTLNEKKSTRLMDLVLTANGVIIDQTVGLSNPDNLLALVILLIDMIWFIISSISMLTFKSKSKS